MHVVRDVLDKAVVDRNEDGPSRWNGSRTAGMGERLGLGVRLILGFNRVSGKMARWDQLDLSHPDRLRISCPVTDLRRR